MWLLRTGLTWPLPLQLDALSAFSVTTACSRECIASVDSIYHQLWLNIHIKCGNFSLKDFKSLDGYVMIWCWSQLLPWDWQPDCLFHISKRKSCPSDDGLLTTMQTVLKQQNVPTCQELVVVTSSHSQNWSPFSGLFSWRIFQYLPKSMWTLGIFGQSYSNLLKSQSCSVRWYFRRIFFQLCCTGCVVFLSVST